MKKREFRELPIFFFSRFRYVPLRLVAFLIFPDSLLYANIIYFTWYYAAVESNLILDLGRQDQTCGCCVAKVWAAEFTGRHVGNAPEGYSICCGKGKVQLPLLRETPPELLAILTSNNRQSRIFFNKGRVYSNMFAFCSFGGTIDKRLFII